jgi:hypothetical protein
VAPEQPVHEPHAATLAATPCDINRSYRSSSKAVLLVLLRHPGSFEGLLTVGEDPEPGEPPALDRPDEREQLIQFHTARLGRALAPSHDHDLVAAVDELAGLDAEVV